MYSRWNVPQCVSRWHSNHYYIIHQGTEKRRDTSLTGKISFKLHTHTGNSFLLWADLLWKLDGVYSRWNVFFVVASAGGTQIIIAQYIREQRNKCPDNPLIGKLSFKSCSHTRAIEEIWIHLEAGAFHQGTLLSGDTGHANMFGFYGCGAESLLSFLLFSPLVSLVFSDSEHPQ